MGSSSATEDAYCLKWNDFHTSITASFSDLRNESDLLDAVIVVEGQQVKPSFDSDRDYNHITIVLGEEGSGVRFTEKFRIAGQNYTIKSHLSTPLHMSSSMLQFKIALKFVKL